MKKNIIIGILSLITAISLFYGFSNKEEKKGVDLTLEQAADIENRLETMKTAKERTDYLTSIFKPPTRRIEFNISKAAPDWCRYAAYYYVKFDHATDPGLRQAYLSAAHDMHDKCDSAFWAE